MGAALRLYFPSGTAAKLLNPEHASGPRTLAGDISHFCAYNHLLAKNHLFGLCISNFYVLTSHFWYVSTFAESLRSASESGGPE